MSMMKQKSSWLSPNEQRYYVQNKRLNNKFKCLFLLKSLVMSWSILSWFLSKNEMHLTRLFASILIRRLHSHLIYIEKAYENLSADQWKSNGSEWWFKAVSNSSNVSFFFFAFFLSSQKYEFLHTAYQRLNSTCSFWVVWNCVEKDGFTRKLA